MEFYQGSAALIPSLFAEFSSLNVVWLNLVMSSFSRG